MRDYADTELYVAQRMKLVEEIHSKGITDERVLMAIGKVPRHLFMPEKLREYAYEDRALPIGEGQTISQPYTVAYQTELLKVHPGHKVLEIGTGSAYQAAVLCEMNAEVYTIERQKRLFEKIRRFRLLSRYKNLHCCFGDGYLGWEAEAPFDRILITAAPPSIPYKLTDQLRMDGAMVVPVGSSGYSRMLRIIKQAGGLVKESFDLFAFVPMLPGKNQ
jgi:protein-L-isoaspartate(D-aspartate) O-methyltransferase